MILYFRQAPLAIQKTLFNDASPDSVYTKQSEVAEFGITRLKLNYTITHIVNSQYIQSSAKCLTCSIHSNAHGVSLGLCVREPAEGCGVKSSGECW